MMRSCFATRVLNDHSLPTMSLTIQQALASAVQQLTDQPDTARLDAELLLAHVLHKSRTWLHTWPEQELSAEQADYIGVPVEGPYKPEHYRY